MLASLIRDLFAFSALALFAHMVLAGLVSLGV